MQRVNSIHLDYCYAEKFGLFSLSMSIQAERRQGEGWSEWKSVLCSLQHSGPLLRLRWCCYSAVAPPGIKRAHKHGLRAFHARTWRWSHSDSDGAAAGWRSFLLSLFFSPWAAPNSSSSEAGSAKADLSPDHPSRPSTPPLPSPR